MFSTLVLLAIVGKPSVAYLPQHTAQYARTSTVERTEQQMLDHLNATRRQSGLRPLVLESHLNVAAAEHARDMAAHNYFDHDSRDGRSPFDRMHADGCRFAYAGENIAMSESESEAYTALMHSPEHRDNILDPHYLRVGIGVASAADGSLVFVQDFSD